MRKAAILNAIVVEHIETAQPVGSAHVTGLPGVEVSSATVRSEMSQLERDGYLVQPHTSAGRVPTDRGYRYFVDHLKGPGVLDTSAVHQVREFYAHVHGEVEEMLERTSLLLAGLTDYASVVVGPAHDATVVRSVQLVGLGPHVALLLVVLADGTVEKRSVDLGADVSPDVLAAASARLGPAVVGRPLSADITLEHGSDDEVVRVVELCRTALGEIVTGRAHEPVFVGGSSHMAAAFDAVETVRSVLSILEQQLVVVELIEEVLDRGMSVAIGAEHGYEPLASCALVVAPVPVEGEVAGTIGVLGPTRMNYPRALAAVSAVGELLGKRLQARMRGGD